MIETLEQATEHARHLIASSKSLIVLSSGVMYKDTDESKVEELAKKLKLKMFKVK